MELLLDGPWKRVAELPVLRMKKPKPRKIE